MSYIANQEWYQKVAAGEVPGFRLYDLFGRNTAVGTTVTPIVAKALGGDFWAPTSASTVRVKAGENSNDSAAGPGARTVLVEGLDENYAFASEVLTLAGTSASASTTTTFRRVFRATVQTTGTYRGNNDGEIFIENTAGTADIIVIPSETSSLGITHHCQFSSPVNSRVYLTQFTYHPDATKANTFGLFLTDSINTVSAPFGTRRTWITLTGQTTRYDMAPASPVLLNRDGLVTPMDIWVSGSVSSTASTITCRLQLIVESTDGAF